MKKKIDISLTELSSRSSFTSSNEETFEARREFDIKYTKLSDSKPVPSAKTSSRKAFWRLFRVTTRFWKEFFGGNFFLFLSTFTQILIPYLSGLMVDSITNKAKNDQLHYFGFIFLIVFAVHGFSTFFQNFLLSILTEKISKHLRDSLFRHIITNDIEFFDEHKTGDLLSRLNNDVVTVKSAAGTSISTLMKSIMVYCGSFLVMFLIAWRLAIVMILVVPIFIMLTSEFMKRRKIYDVNYQKLIAKATVVSEESISSARTVRALAGEEKESRKFENLTFEALRTFTFRSIWGSLYTTGTRTISNGIKLIILWYGGYLAIQGEITSGQLVSFMIYTSIFSGNSRSIGKHISTLATAVTVSERIFEIIDSVPKIQIICSEVNLRTIASSKIEFKNVCFSYPSKQDVLSLNHVSFTIQAGEVVAFVGHSGSGKSTIMNLLERFYEISSGEILIDGQSVQKFNVDFLHRIIGYVSQEPVLFSGSIEDNIAYGVGEYRQEELIDACKLANAWDFISDKKMFPLGLQTLVGERGTQLSGGQKQRIAIARALIKKPRILILDEATSALDAENEQIVQAAVQKLIESNTMTVLIIAHRMSTISKCPRIIVMQTGEIAEEGDHAGLLASNGIYKSLYSTIL